MNFLAFLFCLGVTIKLSWDHQGKKPEIIVTETLVAILKKKKWQYHSNSKVEMRCFVKYRASDEVFMLISDTLVLINKTHTKSIHVGMNYFFLPIIQVVF